MLRAFSEHLTQSRREAGPVRFTCSVPTFGAAEFRIKISFYGDKNRRTTERSQNHDAKAVIFRERKLIQCPFKF